MKHSLVALVVFSCFGSFLSGVLWSTALDPEPEDPALMMECVYGWGQTADNCRRILRGEDPPPLPGDSYFHARTTHL